MPSAKDLIAAKKRVVDPLPPEPILGQLKELIEYNDSCVVGADRVSWQAACTLLTDHGFPCGRERLQSVCRALGRKSWSKP
jgi:hypothetical protein